MMLKMSTGMLNPHDQKLTLDYVVEICKLSTLDENKESELELEPKITMSVSE
jgi:hypothetical protein